MTVALVCFVVFMALWLIAAAPVPQNPGNPYSGLVAFLAVLSLAFCVHVL